MCLFAGTIYLWEIYCAVSSLPPALGLLNFVEFLDIGFTGVHLVSQLRMFTVMVVTRVYIYLNDMISVGRHVVRGVK